MRDHGFDAFCHEVRLCSGRAYCIPLRIIGHNPYLTGTESIRIRDISSRIERGFFIISDISHGSIHQALEERIDKIKHLRYTSEILFKKNTGAFEQTLHPVFFIQFKSVLLADEQIRSGIAEAVNALFDVSDHKQIVAVFSA